MNVLFLTLVQFNSLQERNLYTDLLREFVKNGHYVYAISPVEKKQNIRTHIIEENHAIIISLQIGETQKTQKIRKGINTILLDSKFKKAIKTYFENIEFNLVLYSTPPITLIGTIEYVKRRDKARTYLLLKDIFPQNAVDIGMMSTNGLKGIIYRYFRKKEKRLYEISDTIGCMSPANVKYVLEHNPEVNSNKVEVCPNSVDIIDKSVSDELRKQLRVKYEIPSDKTVFVYGGNLGKPQGIPFLIECLKKCEHVENAFFLIVGAGTEYHSIRCYIDHNRPKNVKLLKHLQKEDYDTLVAACDVGLIFLDHRFTIPNFPSRLLSYMQAKLPVLACTDARTDIGKIIVEAGFGWWCESDNSDVFFDIVNNILIEKHSYNGIKGFKYLEEHYSSSQSYRIIIEGEAPRR